MNRGVEIDSEVADDIDRSLIREQVEMGVAVRMACLDALTREGRPVDRRADSAHEHGGRAQ
jgi:aspartate carbamoyltransferase catalytic subunit